MTGDPAYSPRVGQALQFAADTHAGQRRKGKSEPYLSHILRVANLVAHHGGDEDQLIAAALHDAAEDHGGEDMLHQIEAQFGAPVARLVRECSDTLVAAGAPKPEWRARKQAYLDRVRRRGASAAALIEACDKLANLEDIVEDLQLGGEATLRRFAGGPEGVRWYYQEVGRVLIPQVPELGTRYAELLAALLAQHANGSLPHANGSLQHANESLPTRTGGQPEA